jgi:signal transduction histidine kinase/CheY-like chemotaxis protein
LLLRDVGEGQQVVLPGGWGAARSCLGAPLVRQGKVVGTLLIESDEPDRYGIEEQRAASALAAQAAVALENTRLYAEAQERTRYLKVINEIILAVTTSQDWRGMLNTTIQQIRRLVSCDYAAIALYHAESDAFSIETLYDARGTDELHGTMLPAEHTPWQLAYNAGQPVYQSELSRSAFRRDQELAMRGLRSSVVVPIQGDMGKLGTLNLASRYAGNFSSDQIRLLVELAPYIASALNYLRRQQAEQELVGAREQITVSERMRVESEKLRTIGQIASGVAHDFNNLLAGILGNTQLLLLDEADDERRSLLKVVEQAARDGAETVRRLQTYARMDQHTPLVETRMDLLVSDALELTRPRWRDLSQGRGVTINVVRELHKVPIVAGRPAELREVLTNLIINAVDAMPHGGTLTVGTRAETAEDGLPVVVVSVGDTGCGMQPEVVERIFEPFFTTKGQNGTGLGLPVSKGIIEHHGGTLSVTSAPDQGSRFIIRLPVSDGIAVALPPETPRPIPQSRILVVEDESIVRDALVRLLKSWGHEVSEASGGQQGIDRFAAGRFDMVITDLGMPDRSGWEVLGVVKARDRRVATLLLTGWGNELDKDEARVRGADQLISKPFNQDDLRRALSNALTR